MIGKSLLYTLIFFATTQAGVPGEVFSLDSLYGGSGTRLVSMPTFVYERAAGADGIHSSDELWSPSHAMDRHLPNRYSQILNWQSGSPALWFYTGNEVGDLLHQELLDASASTNRTPMLDGGVTTPAWNGLQLTAQGSQIDHFSSESLGERTRRNGSMSFAWFGENLPAFSTAFTGASYQNGQAKTSLLAGSDYLWALTRTRRWVPVEISPRVQGNASWGRAMIQVAYEKQRFGDLVDSTEGVKEEWSTTFRLACPVECQMSAFTFGGGLSFRHESDSGIVPWGLYENSTIAWPWLELKARIKPGLVWAGTGGSNQDNWLVRDSVEYSGRHERIGFKAGYLNHLGTTLDPMGYQFETYRGDTLELGPDSGYMNLHKLYAGLTYSHDSWNLEGRIWSWLEKGAETFLTESSLEDNGAQLRSGQVTRIGEWLGGTGWSAQARWNYGALFATGASGGWEQLYGSFDLAETKPTQGWAALDASWLLFGALSMDHQWIYRSSASWNQEAEGILAAPGGWSWNATLEQRFPQYRTSLRATWLHALNHDAIQAPRGGYDRTRFYCGIRKEF